MGLTRLKSRTRLESVTRLESWEWDIRLDGLYGIRSGWVGGFGRLWKLMDARGSGWERCWKRVGTLSEAGWDAVGSGGTALEPGWDGVGAGLGRCWNRMVGILEVVEVVF